MPSAKLRSSGVLLRQWDGLSNWDQNRPWEACPADYWCSRWSTVWPATLVNVRSPTLFYSTGKGGMVLSPDFAQFFCAYPGDGNSMGKGCDVEREPACTPGCNFCEAGPGSSWDCAFPPTMLREALAKQRANALGDGGFTAHNELILDTHSVAAGLPDSIEAFFYPDGGREAVRPFRDGFAAEFGLRRERVPLLRYDFENGFVLEDEVVIEDQ